MLKKGPAHTAPKDLVNEITKNKTALTTWQQTTPLAKSEWACWVMSGKKVETRGIRIEKAVSKLSGGMRRPCCWTGCPHR